MLLQFLKVKELGLMVAKYVAFLSSIRILWNVISHLNLKTRSYLISAVIILRLKPAVIMLWKDKETVCFYLFEIDPSQSSFCDLI
jgi:hypothetical protein